MIGRQIRSIALGLVLVAGAASCSDDDAGEAGQPQATPTSTAPATSAGVDIAVDIPDSPDWLTAGFGSLWVKSDNGAVARVSPDGEVEATIDAEIFEQPVCQGIGVSDTAVWACATGGTLIRIDPATNEFTTVDVPKINEQGRLTSSGGLLWLLTGDGDKLQGLTDTGEVSATIELGTFCTDVSDTAAGGVLWVACAYKGLALRVDLEAGKVTGRVRGLPMATSVTADGDVWVGYERGLARIAPESLKVLGTEPLEVGSIRAADERVLVRGPGATALAVIDSTSDEVTTSWGASDLPSPGDVIEVDGRLWATAYDDNLLVRLRE